MASSSVFNPRVARCGWVRIKVGGLATWRGWNTKWLILGGSSLKIYDNGSSSYLEVDLNLAAKVERRESSSESRCIYIRAGSVRCYLALNTDDELNDWLHDIHTRTPLSISKHLPSIRTPDIDVDNSTKAPPLLKSTSESIKTHLTTASLDSVIAQKFLRPKRSLVLGDKTNVSKELPAPPSPVGPGHARRASAPTADEWLDDIIDDYLTPADEGLFSGKDNSGPSSAPVGIGTPKVLRWEEGQTRLQEYVPRHSSVAKKQKIYQNLLCLLMDIAGTDARDGYEAQSNALSEIFGRLCTLSPVSCLVESHIYRSRLLDIVQELKLSDDPDVLEALERDEIELEGLVGAVASSRSGMNAVMFLKQDRALRLLDLVQKTLDSGRDNNIPNVQVEQLASRLHEVCGKSSSSLYIQRVERDESGEMLVGSYSDTYHAVYCGADVALKRLRVLQRGSARKDLRERFHAKARVWQQLDHPNVLPFIGIEEESFPNFMCMVSPWMSRGSVLGYLGYCGTEALEALVVEVSKGIEYLHSKDIIHGDLRGSNILVDDNGHVRIADFGVAMFVDAAVPTIRKGTVRWMAPELLDREYRASYGARYTKACDVYSFACLCVELYTGLPPYMNLTHDDTVARCVLAGDRPAQPDGQPGVAMGDALWALVHTCWRQKDTERPGISSVVEYVRQEIVEAQQRRDSGWF